MIIYVWRYNANVFTKVAVIDNATSVIWVSRFNNTGEFELYLPATKEMLALFQGEIFLTRDNSDVTMYMEKVLLNTDDENGDYLTISGRSAECILGFRIVKRLIFTAASTTAESIIRAAVELYTPTGSVTEYRRFPFLQLGQNNNWDDKVTRQFTGKNLLTLITEMCVEYNYGFRMAFDGTMFTFELYKGIDRSYGQTENTYVIFSPEFENLGNTEYLVDKTNYANAAYVGGEGEGADRKIYGWYSANTSDLTVREIWVDARNTSSKTESGTLTNAEYIAMLKAQGWEAVAQQKITTDFNGEILDRNGYIYGVDYNLGDKVSVENEYGIRGSAQVTAITEVEDETGYRLIPTLSEWTLAEEEQE